MARIRSIKPEFWVSEQIAECSPNARLTFVGLWNFCDDRGVHPAKPKTLKAELYPMDDITAAKVGAWVAELIAAGLVAEFVAQEDGARYWHVTGWDRHQKIDRPSFKHPTPPLSNSTIDQPALGEGSPNTRRAPPPGVEGSGEERKGRDSRSPKASPSPSPAAPDHSAKQAKAATKASNIDRPNDVDAQTWADWLQLRKAKKAPVTQTVVSSAKAEAVKAGMTLDAFLRVWCARGSQGLQAEWLKPHERQQTAQRHPVLDADETFEVAR